MRGGSIDCCGHLVCLPGRSSPALRCSGKCRDPIESRRKLARVDWTLVSALSSLRSSADRAAGGRFAALFTAAQQPMSLTGTPLYRFQNTCSESSHNERCAKVLSATVAICFDTFICFL